MSVVSESAWLAPAPVRRALLTRLIDYAGLFPPAELSMAEAVAVYAEYQAAPEAWVLGRFIVPVLRLEEFESEYAKLPAARRTGWRLNVITDVEPRFDVIRQFAARNPDVPIAGLEVKAMPADVAGFVAKVSKSMELWFEVPPSGVGRLGELNRPRCGAKLRTGGVTANAFPSAIDVALFIRACHAAQVPFKATAGLHHPITGSYPLTYEENAPHAHMFGFLNLLLAATLLHTGGSIDVAAGLLMDSELTDFTAGDDRVGWRGFTFTTEQLAVGRLFLHSFGSCSFLEPIEALRQMQWL